MAQTTFHIDNANKPAPLKFRKIKKGIQMIIIPAIIVMLQTFGVDSLTSTKIQAFMGTGIVAILEFIDLMLSNGEVYATAAPQENEPEKA